MLKILEKGLYTSIQDLGRLGFRKYGVPVSGAMDNESAKLSNLILGNSMSDSVMEITLKAPKLEFLVPTRIAICGANFQPKINGRNIEINQAVSIQAQDILEFGVSKFGARCYLAIAGGFRTEVVLGSRSFYKGITPTPVVENGDLISYNSCFRVGVSAFSQSNKKNLHGRDFSRQVLKATKAPEFELLNKPQKELLLNGNVTIGINSRMAYQLQESIDNQLNPILSSAVLPGTIQLTPSGKLIILMRDCQTTGGYPRVLQLTESGIDCLAQKVQGDVVKFACF